MATELRSPLPGTFYRKPSPDADPFVADGATVAAGDVIGLVEVMKTFHEVKAETGGSNIAFQIENESPVMAGAVIAVVE
ncbi:MAG: acetyl-CoA carboxylase [Pseudomonadota bacterium]